MLLLRRPSESWLRDLAESEAGRAYTYAPAGVTATEATPDGYRRDHREVVLGRGDETFERARGALRQWTPQRGSGLAVGTTGLVEPGAAAALAAPTPVGYVVATCRVVYVEAEDDHYAWAYGTLPIHPERGEERFTVRRDERGQVRFEVDVVWTFGSTLAKLVPPVSRRIQLRATKRYLDAMGAVAGGR